MVMNRYFCTFGYKKQGYSDVILAVEAALGDDFREFRGNSKVVQRSDLDFLDHILEGWRSQVMLRVFMMGMLQIMSQLDQLIFKCTHFPILL